MKKDSRSKPYSGNPTVRDCRGAPGNVVSRDMRAPGFYPDQNRKSKTTDDTRLVTMFYPAKQVNILEKQPTK